ncbi:MAG TPA: hypothetical protein VFQ92_08430, partial [Blastocatellia bacterium]|nr:hypothetical protein [Blastocatellia bacterium]
MIRAVVVAFLLVLAVCADSASAQGLQARADEIRAAMDARDFERAEQLVRALRSTDPQGFTRNNYDYLLARLAERRGAGAEAAALYLGVLNRNSILAQYALRRLAFIAQSAGDLALERQYLTRLVSTYPSSVLVSTARDRL